jgi:hypothetical protein
VNSIEANGEKKPLTEPDPLRKEYGHRLPSFLPNGKALLFTIAHSNYDNKPDVAVLMMDTLQWYTILEDASDARYVPTGHVFGACENLTRFTRQK